MALRRAKTVEEAKQAVEPYMTRLRSTEEPLIADDARPWSRPAGLAKHG
jgi:hypothetical protein